MGAFQFARCFRGYEDILQVGFVCGFVWLLCV